MSRISTTLGVCLLFSASLAHGAISAVLDEEDYIGTDGGGDFLMDVYNLSFAVDMLVTVTMDAGDTLAPWVYLFDTEAITSASPRRIVVLDDWVADIAQTTEIGGEVVLAFSALAGTSYQIVATTAFYSDGDNTTFGDFGDYTINFEIEPPQVQPVPLPAGIWLLASALGLLGLRGRKRIV